MSREPDSIPVTVNREPVEISGSVLIWGAATLHGVESVCETYDFHDLLTIEDMLPERQANPPLEWSERIADLRAWSKELFDFLLPE